VTRHRRLPGLTGDTPRIVTELTAVVVFIAVLALWRHLVTAVQPRLLAVLPDDAPAVAGLLLVGGVLVGGLCCLAAAYATARRLDVSVIGRVGTAGRALVVAAVAPPVLVGTTKLVGDLTGVRYNALTMSSYAAGTPVSAFLSLSLPGLFLGALSLVIVCQVIVQSSFDRVVDGRTAAALTTAFGAVVLSSSTRGLTAFPDRGKLGFAVGFVLALGLACSAADSVDRKWVEYLAYLPVSALVALVAVSWIATTDTAAQLLFDVAHVAVLGLAAAGYDRTDSLLVPAVAYLSVLAADQTVVFVFEAGMRSW
jgi:hypothetical protein